MAITERYSIRGGVAGKVSMPAVARAALQTHPVGVCWTTRAMELADGVGITGPVPRLTDYEDPGGSFFVDQDGAQSDPILDDLALWVRTAVGLVVVLGCGHAGLVNTVREALGLSGVGRLHAVLGGFHLKEASEQRIARTTEDLQQIGPDLVVPCHCTGDAAVERLRRTFGERVVPGSAGAVFRFALDLER